MGKYKADYKCPYCGERFCFIEDAERHTPYCRYLPPMSKGELEDWRKEVSRRYNRPFC